MSTPITPAQESFIRSLLKDRLRTFEFDTVDAACEALGLKQMNKYDASNIIGRLKATPPDPAPGIPAVVAASPKRGVNARASRCEGCGHLVEASAGYYYQTPDLKWAVHHKVGDCNTADPAPVRTVPEAGKFYQCAGQTFVQVYLTQNKRLAAKVMGATGNFVYTVGGVDLVRNGGIEVSAHEVANEKCMRAFGAPLGSEELRVIASKHGHDHGNCIFCGENLTDPRSDPGRGGVGYGPVCAKKYGLPWGTVKK